MFISFDLVFSSCCSSFHSRLGGSVVSGPSSSSCLLAEAGVLPRLLSGRVATWDRKRGRRAANWLNATVVVGVVVPLNATGVC